jgi:hypothetical protein
MIRNEVKRVVADEVKREMTPNFVEMMCRQFIFQSQLNNAVQSQLPNALQQNSGIVSHFIQVHMPSVLCQQHYFQAGINQQKALFDDAIMKQATAYQQQQQNLISRLSQETDTLIAKTVHDVADSSFMMSKLRDTISADVTYKLDQETQQMQKDIDEIRKKVSNGILWSGIIGAGVACGAMSFLSYFGL